MVHKDLSCVLQYLQNIMFLRNDNLQLILYVFPDLVQNIFKSNLKRKKHRNSAQKVQPEPLI